jgi:PAS domain S-box-containing protein
MRDIKVLVAEDEAVTALNIKSMLGRFGYTVIGPVAYGEHAVEIFRSQKPDVLIMDITLAGDITGIEAVEEIKAISDVPVVYQTAHSDSETINAAKEFGHDGYIVKPYNQYDLVSALEIAIFSHTLRNDNNDGYLEHSPIASIIWDKECKIKEWNKKAEEIFGFQRSEAVGQNIYDLIIEDDHKDLVTNTINELLEERASNTLINMNVRSDGKKIWCKWNNSSIIDKKGNFIGIISLGIDITDTMTHKSPR